MRAFWLAVAGACVAIPASAHDFWLQPANFWLAPGASTAVTLLVGHGPNRELWDADIGRVTRLISIGPAGTTDLRGTIRQGGVGRVTFEAAGMQVLVLETGHTSSELPAIRFNDYLQAEGITPAIRARERAGLNQAPGREIYSRRAKALIRVGDAPLTDARTVTTPVGMTLEIVPEQNPYTAPAGRPLSFIIYYEGRPLSGAFVKLTNLAADAEPAATQRSNSAGRVAFTLPRRGDWQMNVVWTRPITGNDAADFDTTFSSLTFGFRERSTS